MEKLFLLGNLLHHFFFLHVKWYVTLHEVASHLICIFTIVVVMA